MNFITANTLDTPNTTLYQSFAIDCDRSLEELEATVYDTSAGDILWGSTEKFITALSFTPINLYDTYALNRKNSDIVLGNDEHIEVYNFAEASMRTWYCGTFYYRHFKLNNYRDYEPYTKVIVYLPFYGEYEIPMKYVNKYYISFWLKFDGDYRKATYFITGDSTTPTLINDVSEFTRADAKAYDFDNQILISTLDVSLFVDIPVSTNGLSDMKRNLALGALTSVVSSTGHILTSGIPNSTTHFYSTVSPHTKTTNIKSRSPKTNKLRTSYIEEVHHEPIKTEKTYTHTHNNIRDIMGDVIDGTNTAISNLHNSAHSEKPQGGCAVFGEQTKVIVYIMRQKCDSLDDKLSPKPCFYNGELNKAFEITEIGINHFNSYNKYVSPKMNEIAIINDYFEGQIICRPNLIVNPIILGDNFSKELLYTKSIFENLNDVEYAVNNNGIININGYRIYHNHIPVRYDDFPATQKYFIANLPLGQDTFNLSFDFCNNVIPSISPNTYWEEIINTDDITSVGGNIHINAKFDNVTNIDIPISYNSINSNVEEKDMIIPSENKTTYEAIVNALKVITNDGEKLFYFGNDATWTELVINPVYNYEIDYGSTPYTFSNGYIFYKGNQLFYNGIAVRDTDRLKDFNTPYTI